MEEIGNVRVTKVQSQLLVSPLTRDRADTLAKALMETRAEIYRRALDRGLRTLEEEYQDLLADGA